MATRADFYIQKEESLEWLGSITWDGNEKRIPQDITQSCSEEDFTDKVSKFLDSRTDSFKPKDGWPWHWDTSKQTDYSYIYNQDKCCVYISNYGSLAYTIYQFRDYSKKKINAKKEGKSIIPFVDYIEKISSYVPKFPVMRKSPSER